MAKLTNEEIRLQTAVADTMEALGLNKKDLAKKAFVSLSTVDNALTGRAKLSAGMWKGLCNALGLDYDQIIAPLTEEEQKVVEAECAQTTATAQPAPPVIAENMSVLGQAPTLNHPIIMPKEGSATFRKLTNYDIYGLGNWDRCVTIDCPRSSLAELGKYVQAKLYTDIEAGMKRSPRNLYSILDAWMAIMTAAQTEEQHGAD